MVIILILVIAVGCSSDDEPDVPDEVVDTVVETTDEPEEEIILDETVGIGLDTDEIRLAIAHMDMFDDLQVFELETLTVHTLINEANTIRLFVYYGPDEDKAQGVVFRILATADEETVDSAVEVHSELSSYLSELLSLELFDNFVVGQETIERYQVFFLHTDFFETVDLPWTVATVVAFEPSFLEMTTFAYAQAFDFESILALVETYEDEFEEEGWIVGDILTLATRALELLEDVSLYVEVDDFDDSIISVTAYYDELRNITLGSEANVVPYLQSGPEGILNLYLRMGLIRGGLSGWLSFDQIQLRLADGSIRNFDDFSARPERTQSASEIGSIGMVREQAIVSFNFEQLGDATDWLVEQMDVDADHMIRFSNTSIDENHDETLSAIEINGMKILGELFQIIGQFSHD